MGKTFFSLSAGLQRAGQVQGLSSAALAKEAAVVADELIIESGLQIWETDVEALYWNGGTTAFQALEDPWAAFASVRDFVPGRTWGQSVHRRKLRFDPPETHAGDAHTVARRWYAEFYSGILDELVSLKPEWLKVVRITGEGTKLVFREKTLETVMSRDPDAARSGTRGRVERAYAELVEEARPFHPRIPQWTPDEPPEERIRQRLGWDFYDGALKASALDAQFVASREFAGLALGQSPIKGRTSLTLLAPNVTNLPWEAICEFRGHPGAEEARHLMREFENRALASGPDESYEFLRGVATEVVNALVAAAQELRPSLPEVLAEELMTTAVGLVPVVGTFAALGLALGEAAIDISSYERSWVAALMTLRRR